MISYEEFEEMVVNILKRDISSNKEQKKAIASKPDESLFIVAGPGSGKTTVIVLKILKYIFVDDIAPNEILSTTFTKKAAEELYSRILSWGDQIKKHLSKEYEEDKMTFETAKKILEIEKIDFNQIHIGTIDSIAEDVLRVHKEPGTNLPVIVENFVAKSAMVNAGLLKNNRYLDEKLKEYLKNFSSENLLNNPEKMAGILLEMKDRIYYDEVDYYDLLNTLKDNEGGKLALDIIADYETELKNRNVIDFPMLNYNFLDKLKNHKLDSFLDEIKIILVDEYQDTNLIQEDIYFTIAKSAIENGGNLTVVGDDDQSLYRFRGATVDLFTDFKIRVREKLGINVEEINLRTNYRSSNTIINHCNTFVALDKKYQSARVDQKPKIVAPEFKDKEMPILGMFRNNIEMLSKDLANLIENLINTGKVELPVYRIIKKGEIIENKNDLKIKLELDKEHGSASDIAVLSFSPKEVNHGTYLFPYYLRNELENDNIPVFNPRGQDLQDIPEVSIFCGLILECIDPDSKIQNEDKAIPQLAKRNMRKWRLAAKDFIKENPKPHNPLNLKEFVTAWQLRKPINYKDNKWPPTASLMELAYKLTTWIENLQEDIEGIVYLEAITKTITQTGFFNKYSGKINFESYEKEKDSIKEAIWNIFIPIATGGVEIDENLLDTLPKNRVNIMSIHQSKGLEFPLVIVDVGSRFKKNDVRTQRLRFPKSLPKNTSLEDTVRVHSSLGENKRELKDRTFDDLTRLYFVSFSRAENVLILVGLNQSIDGYGKKDKKKYIPNVALGWTRNEKYIGFDEIYII